MINFKGFIYKIENRENGKKYIGQTIGPVEERWEDHYKMRGGAEKLYNAMRKYTDKEGNYLTHDYFDFSVQEEILTYDFDDLKAKLSEQEKYWIAYYDSHRNGYNRNSGGQDGKYSLVYYEAIKVMEMWTDYKKHGLHCMSSLAEEFKCSSKVIKNILKMNGVTNKDITQRAQFFMMDAIPVSQIEIPNGRIIAYFNSAYEAQTRTRVYGSSILSCINGLSNHAGGYFWIRTNLLTQEEKDSKQYLGEMLKNINGRKYDHDEVLFLNDQGLTAKEISKIIGCSTSNVRIILRQVGLNANKSLQHNAESVMRIHPKTRKMKKYDSIDQAKKENGGGVARSLKLGNKANGFFYKYLHEISESDLMKGIYTGELIDKREQDAISKGDPIVCVDKNGKAYRFYSISAAAEYYKFSTGGIHGALNRESNSYKNFHWFYEWKYLENYKNSTVSELNKRLENKLPNELIKICDDYHLDYTLTIDEVINVLADIITNKKLETLKKDEERIKQLNP